MIHASRAMGKLRSPEATGTIRTGRLRAATSGPGRGEASSRLRRAPGQRAPESRLRPGRLPPLQAVDRTAAALPALPSTPGSPAGEAAALPALPSTPGPPAGKPPERPPPATTDAPTYGGGAGPTCVY